MELPTGTELGKDEILECLSSIGTLQAKKIYVMSRGLVQRFCLCNCLVYFMFLAREGAFFK